MLPHRKIDLRLHVLLLAITNLHITKVKKRPTGDSSLVLGCYPIKCPIAFCRFDLELVLCKDPSTEWLFATSV